MRNFVYAAIAVAAISAAAWAHFMIETADAEETAIDIMALQAGSKDLPVSTIDGLI